MYLSILKFINIALLILDIINSLLYIYMQLMLQVIQVIDATIYSISSKISIIISDNSQLLTL